MSKLSRRGLIRGTVASAVAGAMPAMAAPGVLAQGVVPVRRRDRIHQSVCRWCYQKIPLEDLCSYSAQIGLKAVDLLKPEEYEVQRAEAG